MDKASARDTLLRLINGFQVSQAIHVAAILGIADLLDNGPKPVEEMAAAVGVDVSALARLLRALASVGIFSESEGTYQLTPLAEYLRSDAPGSLRFWAIRLGQPDLWQTWGHLLDSVRTGESPFPELFGVSPWEYREANPDANAVFNQAMTGLAIGVVDAIAESYDFSAIKLLVDVGGGEGALLATILSANPMMRGVLFDRPHVVAEAGPLLERAGVASRCEITAGSFFDAVPAGADAYLLKSIVHDWDDDSARRILDVCRTAVAAGGKLLVVEPVIQPGNAPDPAKYSDLNMLVMLGGRERTSGDFERLFAASGFRLARIVPTASGFSVIEGAPV